MKRPQFAGSIFQTEPADPLPSREPGPEPVEFLVCHCRFLGVER